MKMTKECKLEQFEYLSLKEFLDTILKAKYDKKESVPLYALATQFKENSSKEFLKEIKNFENNYAEISDKDNLDNPYIETDVMLNLESSYNFFKEFFEILNGIRFWRCFLDDEDDCYLIDSLIKISKKLKFKFGYYDL